MIPVFLGSLFFSWLFMVNVKFLGGGGGGEKVLKTSVIIIILP